MIFKLELVTEEQGQYYIDTAKAWHAQQSGFGSSTSAYAVAEYLANEDGRTLYESRKGREYDRPDRDPIG